MNYLKHYNDLILRAKFRKIYSYTESHHVIPKCMGGSDNKDNLVDLTAREHFIAHLLLWKIYPKELGLINAVFRMTHSNNHIGRVNNRMYSWLKEVFSRAQSERQIKRKGQYVWLYNIDTNVPERINIKQSVILLQTRKYIKGKLLKKCACGNIIFHNNGSKWCTEVCKKKIVYCILLLKGIYPLLLLNI